MKPLPCPCSAVKRDERSLHFSACLRRWATMQLEDSFTSSRRQSYCHSKRVAGNGLNMDSRKWDLREGKLVNILWAHGPGECGEEAKITKKLRRDMAGCKDNGKCWERRATSLWLFLWSSQLSLNGTCNTWSTLMIESKLLETTLCSHCGEIRLGKFHECPPTFSTSWIQHDVSLELTPLEHGKTWNACCLKFPWASDVRVFFSSPFLNSSNNTVFECILAYVDRYPNQILLSSTPDSLLYLTGVFDVLL